MKLRIEQLANHLESDIAPLYLISGDEPFQLDEACRQVRQRCEQQGYNERELFHVDKSFDWQQLQAAAGALSLFAQQRVIELRLPSGKPGTEGARALVEYCAQLPQDTVLLIVAGKLDASQTRSKWFKALEQAGVVVQVWPIEKARLPAWVRQRMQLRGMQPSEAALTMLVDRVEGNLLAADQELEKLRLLYGEGSIDEQQVAAAVSDSARFDVFGLVDAALAGDVQRTTRILYGLMAEGVEAVVVLWALAREIRSIHAMATALEQGQSLDAVLAQYRVWDKRKPQVRAALQRFPARRWQGLLWQSGEIDRIIKGLAAGKAWDELLQLSLKIGGTMLFRRPMSRRA
ncbi:MAG: DNA polymerase III subunit delta [Thioalkalispiraceae bacterium]|jgi:DNA polymerase-3 subunit delta